MPTPLIYALVVLIWGTTWYTIKFQLGVVAPEISLVYRFGLAAVCVFIYARATGSPLKLSLRDHRMVALQGATLFCLNYWMTYLSTQYLTSGLVAVLFTSIIFFNIVNARVIFGTRIERRVLLAAGAGMLGVALLFLPELQVALHDPTIIHGAVLALAATYVASLGNMAASRNTQAGLPVVTVNAYGLAYGTVGLALIATIRGTPDRVRSARAVRALAALPVARGHGACVWPVPRAHPAHRRVARGLLERAVPGRGPGGLDAVRRLCVEPAGDRRAAGAGCRQCACARRGRTRQAMNDPTMCCAIQCNTTEDDSRHARASQRVRYCAIEP